MKMTKLEKQWVLYDVGNSAFIMLVSTIIPIYFKNMASEQGIAGDISTAYWGYAASIATIIIALLGPVCGTLGDHKGYKLPLFATFLLIGVGGCAALGLPVGWLGFLAIFVIAKVGYSGSLIFYDAMLCDVSSDERMDMVSSNGYAWGYLGSCAPFILCLLMILTADQTGLGTLRATVISFIITALWWLCCSVPLMRKYRQKNYINANGSAVASSFRRLWGTLKKITKDKHIFTFLIAFFLYIDGVYTIIEMATSYGKDVGINDNSLLMALLLTQVVAFPFAILFGKLAKKVSATKIIQWSILGYIGIALFALQLDKAWEFWLLAVWVAVFQGGIQALSRSYFAKIVPREQSNEYFGLYDIFGKGAAFTGTFLIGLITHMTGSSKYGVAILPVLFLAGYFVLQAHLKVKKYEK